MYLLAPKDDDIWLVRDRVAGAAREGQWLLQPWLHGSIIQHVQGDRQLSGRVCFDRQPTGDLGERSDGRPLCQHVRLQPVVCRVQSEIH